MTSERNNDRQDHHDNDSQDANAGKTDKATMPGDKRHNDKRNVDTKDERR